MDNPISSNNIEINNSISNLSFLWTAIFSDGTKIKQFNEDGSENRFQLIKDKFDSLQYFILEDKEKSIQFIADLKKGLISTTFNNTEKQESIGNKNNLRLIFFRRHTITMTESGNQQSHTIVYHLGLQWNDNLGNNQKIILKIDSEGNFIIGE